MTVLDCFTSKIAAAIVNPESGRRLHETIRGIPRGERQDHDAPLE
jgi:hypothetical protein